MREEEEEEEEEEEGGKWFSRWEEQLPPPEELMPLSQTLITPDLALAFDIPTTTAAAAFDSADPSGGGGGDEAARTLKRPRLVWTPQLHKRFVEAVAHLGIKNAVPKTIMQLMSVEGLTRENVASHLQKYRLYLNRMQQRQQQQQQGGLLTSSGGPADAATDQLFATAPIPHHFLRGSGAGGGPAPPPEPPFVPFVPVVALHHHQQMVQQQQQYHQRQMGHFGSAAAMGMGVGFDHGGFITRGQPPPHPGPHHRMGPPVPADSEGGGRGGGGRKMLTLFPTGEED